MSNSFIIFNNYYQFKNYENILMSLIVGLNNSKRNICFSNGYAALKCGVSISTITRTISKFVDKGFISCYYTPQGRIIHLLKTPLLVDEIEDCDISTNNVGVITTTTPPNHTDYTPNHDDYTPSSQEVGGVVSMTNNNIDYNIEDNIDNNIEHTIEKNLIEKEKISKSDFYSMVSEFIKIGLNQDEAAAIIKEEYEIYDI